MGRPSIEGGLRHKLLEYLKGAELLSSEEAPLNTLAVARALGVNRKTIIKYRLDEEIKAAKLRQRANSASSPKKRARLDAESRIIELRRQAVEMTNKCEGLIVKICLAEGNAQRLGINPTELWRDLPLPNRSVPHTGRSSKNSHHSKRRF